MKRLLREKNTAEMLDAFQDKLDELNSSKEIESSILLDDDESDSELVDGCWEKLDSKVIRDHDGSFTDYDGFFTDYSIWFNHETGEYITLLGDEDLYNPSNKDPDVKFGTNADEAWSFFEKYSYEDDF